MPVVVVLAAGLGGTVGELDRDRALVAAALDGELELVAGLLRVDRRDHVVHAGHRVAVDGGDQVAADAQLLPGNRDAGVVPDFAWTPA